MLPRNQKNLHVFPTPSAFVEGVSCLLVQAIGRVADERGLCRLVLAGGNTLRRIYHRLGESPFREQIPWNALNLYWGDERAVPPDHPDSNYRMVREALLDHVPIPEEQIHRIPSEHPPEKAACLYEQELMKQFQGRFPEFDIILLGLGTDGHTASLFPNSRLLQNTEDWVATGYVSQERGWRISLTLPVLNRGERIYFLVSGKRKASIVRTIFNLSKPSYLYPASLIQPKHGELHWFLDVEAAALLKHVTVERRACENGELQEGHSRQDNGG